MLLAESWRAKPGSELVENVHVFLSASQQLACTAPTAQTMLAAARRCAMAEHADLPSAGVSIRGDAVARGARSRTLMISRAAGVSYPPARRSRRRERPVDLRAARETRDHRERVASGVAACCRSPDSATEARAPAKPRRTARSLQARAPAGREKRARGDAVVANAAAVSGYNCCVAAPAAAEAQTLRRSGR